MTESKIQRAIAVMALLNDQEWSEWSDREISRRCAVSHPFVSSLRETLSGNGYQIPNERKVERNGTTYTQNTANIGKPQKREEPEPLAEDNEDECDFDFKGWLGGEDEEEHRMTTTGKKRLTVGEVAEELGCSTDFVRKQFRCGLAHIKLGDRIYLIEREDLEAYLASKKVVRGGGK